MDKQAYFQVRAKLRVVHSCMAMLFILFLPCTTTFGYAETEGQASVIYLTRTEVYVELGSFKDVLAGDELVVETRLNGQITKVSLIVKEVTSHTAVCMIGNLTVKVGDKLVQVRRSKREHITPDHEEATPSAKSVVTQDMPQPMKSSVTESISGGERDFESLLTVPPTMQQQVSGRFGLSYSQTQDGDVAGYSYQRSSAILRLDAGNLINSPLSLRFFARMNNTESDTSQRGENPDIVLYQASLEYKRPGKPMVFSLGRILPERVSGIGYFDGFILGVQTQKELQAGLMGGYYPNLVSGNPQTTEPFGGLYLSKDFQLSTKTDYELSVAAVSRSDEQYKNSAFMYLQNRMRYASKFSFFQSAEFYQSNAKSAQSENGNSSTTQLALENLYLDMTFSPVHSFSLSLSYDNRKNNFLYERQRVTLDELFDKQVRQGYHLSMFIQPWRPWALSIGGGILEKESNKRKNGYGNAQLSFLRLFGTGFDMMMDYQQFAYDDIDARSEGVNLAYSRSFLSFNVAYHAHQFDYLVQQRTQSRAVYDAAVNMHFGGNYRLSLQYQMLTGDDVNSQSATLAVDYYIY